jgi:hypothetical protein
MGFAIAMTDSQRLLTRRFPLRGCGEVNLGFDNDGVRDCHDGFPEIIDKTVPGLRGCGEVNTGSDSDDECPPKSCKDSGSQMWL